MSVCLILRPSTFHKDRPWALQLRYSSIAETEYETLAGVSDQTARDIISAGKAYWLFGEPDWAALQRERSEAEILAKADAINERRANEALR